MCERRRLCTRRERHDEQGCCENRRKCNTHFGTPYRANGAARVAEEFGLTLARPSVFVLAESGAFLCGLELEAETDVSAGVGRVRRREISTADRVAQKSGIKKQPCSTEVDGRADLILQEARL